MSQYKPKPSSDDCLKLPKIETRRSISASTASTKDSIDHECSICMNVIVEPVNLPGCNHLFCAACVLNTFKNSKRKCPLCRKLMPGNIKFDAGSINKKLQSKIMQEDALGFFE